MNGDYNNGATTYRLGGIGKWWWILMLQLDRKGISVGLLHHRETMDNNNECFRNIENTGSNISGYHE